MPENHPPAQSDARTRIMAIRNGETKPLFDSVPLGSHSPSPSLLIEKHEVCPTEWQTVIIPEQVVTLYLRRCAVEYGDGAVDRDCLIRAKGSVVIEKRDCEQRFRWRTSASTLSVRLSDAALEQTVGAVPLTSEGEPADRAVEDTRLSSLL